MKKTYDEISAIAMRRPVDRIRNGKITAVSASGKYRVGIDENTHVWAFNQTALSFDVGDMVSVSCQGGDLNRVDIIGRASQKIGTTVRRVWK